MLKKGLHTDVNWKRGIVAERGRVYLAGELSWGLWGRTIGTGLCAMVS